MEKLELWEQNEPLFHDKLNDEVKTVNEIIDEISKNQNQTFGSSSSITYPQQFYSTQRELLQMWNADGEGVVLSGYNYGFLGDAGLYARNNEAVVNGKRFVPNDRKLKKIANWSCLQDGGILYQEITLSNGTITNSELKYTNNALPNDTETKVYRALSRIVTDCRNKVSCGAKAIYKAIAINETRLNNNFPGGGNIIIDEKLKGLIVACGAGKTWEELKEKHTLFTYWDWTGSGDGQTVAINAQNISGYLKITREEASCC